MHSSEFERRRLKREMAWDMSKDEYVDGGKLRATLRICNCKTQKGGFGPFELKGVLNGRPRVDGNVVKIPLESETSFEDEVGRRQKVSVSHGFAMVIDDKEVVGACQRLRKGDRFEIRAGDHEYYHRTVGFHVAQLNVMAKESVQRSKEVREEVQKVFFLEDRAQCGHQQSKKKTRKMALEA